MPEKSGAEKMRLKSGMTATVLHEPEGSGVALGIPPDVTVVQDPSQAEFILDFATSQAEAQERLEALEPHVGEKTLVWLAYPKGSKAAGYDVNRDTIFQAAADVGLVLVANVALDQKWSAVRIRRA